MVDDQSYFFLEKSIWSKRTDGSWSWFSFCTPVVDLSPFRLWQTGLEVIVLTVKQQPVSFSSGVPDSTSLWGSKRHPALLALMGRCQRSVSYPCPRRLWGPQRRWGLGQRKRYVIHMASSMSELARDLWRNFPPEGFFTCFVGLCCSSILACLQTLVYFLFCPWPS